MLPMANDRRWHLRLDLSGPAAAGGPLHRANGQTIRDFESMFHNLPRGRRSRGCSPSLLLSLEEAGVNFLNDRAAGAPGSAQRRVRLRLMTSCSAARPARWNLLITFASGRGANPTAIRDRDDKQFFGLTSLPKWIIHYGKWRYPLSLAQEVNRCARRSPYAMCISTSARMFLATGTE